MNILFEAIRRKCILLNFRENYKKQDLLGSGSFANVRKNPSSAAALFNPCLQVFKVQRNSDGKIFAAKIIKQDKLEENKHKDKFVVSHLTTQQEPLKYIDNLLPFPRQC